MKVDLFLMNPPYNSGPGGVPKKNVSQKNTTNSSIICVKIMKALENRRVVCISNYGGFGSIITKMTSVEKVVFPGILCSTWIWTINDNKPVLFPNVYKLKRVKKSNYFFLRLGTGYSIYQIRKENKSEYNRMCVDVKNDEEMCEINKYIKDNFEPYKVFACTMQLRPWILANILYNSPWRERFVK